MCGRFTLRTPTPVLIDTFRASVAPEWSPRFNIAPTQSIPVVRQTSNGEREIETMHWGLIPFWAKEPGIGNRMINARSETLTEKPAFRQAANKRRCLVITDGYFEWKKMGKTKQPYWIRMRDEGPFAMAGLWESWRGPPATNQQASDPLLSCTIVTTTSNALTQDVHDRMPVILDPEDWETWLAPERTADDEICALMRPFDSDPMKMDAVSTRVNNVRNDDAECVQIQRELF